MKKPKLNVEGPKPRNIQRADIAPADGYALVVEGHFKTQFAENAAAKKAATGEVSHVAGRNLRRILEVTKLREIALFRHRSSR
jgi:hypothetical protein